MAEFARPGRQLRRKRRWERKRQDWEFEQQMNLCALCHYSAVPVPVEQYERHEQALQRARYITVMVQMLSEEYGLPWLEAMRRIGG